MHKSELTIRNELELLAEEKYQVFASKLIPNIKNLIGVRLPLLRKLAKRLTYDESLDYIKVPAENLIYFEETMLQGMIIGGLNLSWKERAEHVENFVPKINNWSVCDSFCSGLKFKDEEKDEVWEFIQKYSHSRAAYDLRFFIVMALFYFVDEKYSQDVFTIFNKIKHDDYYVKMAVSWAISIYYRELPAITMTYLNSNKLDDWTYNKALQKITESLVVSDENKRIIRSIKRK